MIEWQDLHHSQLTPSSLYALLALRNEVFVVEQDCPYQDIDGEDLLGDNRHLLGWRDQQLVAYARLLKRQDDHMPVAIGRVIVAPQARGQKIGYQLLTQAILSCERHWPEQTIHISAQAHLQAFYGHFGFVPVTGLYDEDGIAHIGMARGEDARAPA